MTNYYQVFISIGTLWKRLKRLKSRKNVSSRDLLTTEICSYQRAFLCRFSLIAPRHARPPGSKSAKVTEFTQAHFHISHTPRPVHIQKRPFTRLILPGIEPEISTSNAHYENRQAIEVVVNFDRDDSQPFSAHFQSRHLRHNMIIYST